MKYADRVNWVAGKAALAWDIHYNALLESERDEEVIVLSVGDPDFSTPEPIISEAARSLNKGDTHYTPVLGRRLLRDAVAKNFEEQGGPSLSSDNVAILAGAQNALFTASLCILSAGDEVITFDPMYLTYAAYIGVSGASLVRVACDANAGFRPDISALEAAITSNTRAIAFSNPNNPSGVVMSRDELGAIAELAKQYDLWVISDEVYATLTFENSHIPIASLPEMSERTITIASLSKSHAMTGWRVGWMIAPEELIGHVENLALCMLYGLPGFVQQGAIEALTGSFDESKKMRDIYRRRRDLVADALEGVSGLKVLLPQSGMFVLVDVRGTGMAAIDFARDLYAQEKVSVLDGAAFGDNTAGFIRLSFTNSERILLEGCERIRRFVERVKS